MTQLVRSAHGSVTTLFASNGFGGTFGSHYMPWNPVMLPDGTELVVARKSSGHSAQDGNLVAKTRAPGGSWSAEATILDTAYNEADGALGLLADGTICMTWNRVSWTPPADPLFYAPFSTCPPGDDPLVAANWTTPVHITGTGLANDWRVGTSILELTPGGRIVVGLYGTPAFPPWTEDQCWVAYSDDGGATWAMLSQIDNGNAHGLSSSAEPQLVRCADGSVLAVYRTITSPWEAWARRSTDECASWSAEWRIATDDVNKNGACITPDGDVVLAYNNSSSALKFKQSWDDGDTFGTAQTPGGTGNLFALPYVIGEEAVTPNVAIVYGYETGGQLVGNIYYQQLTRGSDNPAPPAAGYGDNTSAGYGTAEATTPAALTIDPASTAWEQVGTSITVRTTSDDEFAPTPATVTATVNSPAGGLLRFRGTDAARFAASVDGTTWASTVDIPAGENTIYLRVTPTAAGTTMSAEIGVPI